MLVEFFRSIRTRVIALFLLAIAIIMFFSYEVNKIIKNNEIIYSKYEIIYLIQSITHFILDYNLPAIKAKINESNFELVQSLPENYQVLYLDKQMPSVMIFATQSNIGFQIIYNHHTLIAQSPIRYTFIGKNQIIVFLFFSVVIIVIFGLIILHLLYPLQQIQNSLKSFSAQKTIKLNIKRKDEIGDLVNAFNAMSERISDMVRTRELILRSIGHELKHPLAKMKLFVEIEKQNGNPSALKFLDYVNDLQNLIDNLLAFGQLNSGKITLNKQSFLVETLALKTLKDFEKMQDKIILDIQENFSIKGDLELLSIAFKNLVENGLKYSKTDTITISIRKNKIHIISQSAPLSEPFSAYLEPFFRDQNHETMPGHGLGLPIVNDILSLHHYKLRYKYTQGKHYFCMWLM